MTTCKLGVLFLLVSFFRPGLSDVASSYQVYKHILPNSSLPNVATTPIIQIANSLPLSGTYASLGSAALQAITVWVNTANAQGGVFINGQRHYFSFTTIDDGTTGGYVVDIYQQYISQIQAGTANISVLFAPWSSTLTLPALKTVVQSGLNITFFAIGSGSPSVYVNGAGPVYRYCYGTSLLSNHQLDYPLASVINSLEPPIRRVAVFYRPDSFATPIYGQFMQWVTAQNVTIVANVLVSSLAVDASSSTVWAKQFLSAMPDTSVELDLLFICTANAADQQAAAGGLSISQHNPKMAFFPQAIVDTDPTVLQMGEQWTTLFAWNSDVNYTTSVPYAVFPSTAAFSTAINAWYSVPTQVAHVQAAASLELLISALSSTKSLEAEDMRNALINITGFTVWNYHAFDPVYQYDVDLRETLYQIRSGADHRVDSSASLMYPAAWPWLIKPKQGDSLQVTSSFSTLVLAVVLSVFGSWIALLLVEQLLVFRRAGSGRYWAWLMLTAVAVGAGATWTSLVCVIASITVPCSLCTVSTSLSYSVAALILALLPAVLLTFVGHFLLSYHGRVGRHSGKMQLSSTKGSVSIAPSQLSSAAEGEDEKKILKVDLKISSLLKQDVRMTLTSLAEYLWYQSVRLVRRVQLPFLLGAIAVTGAIILTRVTLTLSLVGNIAWTSSALANLFSTLVCLLLTLVSMLAYYYATRFRLLGVLLFSAAIHVDFQFQLALARVSYEPSQLPSLPGSFTSLTLSSSVLIGTAAIVGGVLGLIFIYMQFSVMKLSNHEIAMTVSKMKKKIDSTETELQAERCSSKRYQLYAAAANKVLEATNITRPLAASESSNYAAAIVPVWAQLSNTAFDQSVLFKAASEVDRLMHARPEAEDMKDAGEEEEQTLEKAFLLLLRSATERSSEATSAICTTSHLSEAQFKYLSSALRVSHFLAHPFTTECLKDELQRQLSVENVMFLLHVRKWKQEAPHSVQQKELASQLVAQFIREGSPFQVNIHATLRSNIEKAYARGSVESTLFALAEKETLSLIETNNMKAFRASPLFPACVHMLGYNWHTMKAIHAQGMGGGAERALLMKSTTGSTVHRGSGSRTREPKTSISQPAHSFDEDGLDPLHGDSVTEVKPVHVHSDVSGEVTVGDELGSRRTSSRA